MQNGMPIFLTSVLTMGHPSSLSTYDEKAPGCKGHADQHHHHHKKKRKHRRKHPISGEYRNVRIQSIPPFNAEAVRELGDRAVTHNITTPCNLEIFEADPSVIHNRTTLCRSRSFG